MLALDQLKEMVLKNFEKSGYLDNVRAQLKYNVLEIIENQGKDLKQSSGFQWEHPIINKLQEQKDGKLALKIICEFLEFFKFDYTLSVFRKEAKLPKQVQKDQIVDELNLKHNYDQSKPIIMQMINDIQRNQEAAQNMSISQSNSSVQFKQQTQDDEKSQNNIQQETSARQKQDEEKQQRLEFLKKLEQEKAKAEEQERIKQEQEELEKKRKREMIEKKFEEDQEKERQQEEEQAKKKKLREENQKKRPQTAPEKKKPATAVNKIRGVKNVDEENVQNFYGFEIGNQQQMYQDQDYGQEYDDQQNKVANNDPYAFDISEAQFQRQTQTAGSNFYKAPQSDPYSYNITDNSMPKTQTNKFGGISGQGSDPYSYDIDIGNNQKPTKQNQQINKQKKTEDIDEYLEEEIEDFTASKDSNVNNNPMANTSKERKNPIFSSSEDVHVANQSQGYDQSVDSDAIENYDYYETVTKKKK